MKNISTGTGLCVAGLCAVAFPFAQKLASVGNQAHAGVTASAVAAVASSATVQVTPTIVWYGTTQYDHVTYLFRSWSDGRVERKTMFNYPANNCNAGPTCNGQWIVISDPAQGLAYRSDINFDEQVDGADLGQLLADWGNAPRQDIPPSDCPLALINP
jgi:hypothetical protein